jgi:hypothetical protein
MARKFCDEAINHFKKQMAFWTNQKIQGFMMYDCDNRFDSPIEEILFAELSIRNIFEQTPNRIFHQVQEGPYKIDIAAYFEFGSNIYKVAIECDGHDYHERTED